MSTRAQSTVARRSRSGPTKTNEQRRATGRVRLPTVWLSAEEYATLERLSAGRSIRDVIAEGIHLASESMRARERRQTEEDAYDRAMAKLAAATTKSA